MMTADEQLKRWMEHLSHPFRDLDRMDQIKLLQAVGVMREALKFLVDREPRDISGYACTFCDMGGAGYSSKGDGHHDDVRDVCPVFKASEALASVEQALGGGKLE